MNAANGLLLFLSLSLSIFTSGPSAVRGRGPSRERCPALADANVAWPPSVTDEQQVEIKGAWVQEGPPSQTITAAFMVIENHGSTEIALLSASTDAARVVELHKMELEDGMMRMHRVDSIRIPAGGSVELKPGGYHLMVIGLKKNLKEGDEVSFALQFSGEIRKTLKVPVKRRDSMTEGDKTGR